MDLSLLLDSLLNPAVLFFFLGMAAALARSDLEIPQPLPKFFSLYLLIAIGLKGGAGLRAGGLAPEVLATLGAALVMSVVIPLAVFFLLRRRLDAAHAAAIAATYGSVSAVTFIAATALLRGAGVPYGGHMVAALALMESPAIIVGVALARRHGAGVAEGEPGDGARPSLLREAFLNGSVFLLVGSLVIGVLIGDKGAQALGTFTDGMFKGILCLFLLDMGLVSARRLAQLRQLGAVPVLFALLAPLVQGGAGVLVARLLGLGAGDAVLFAVLCGSASYIAVPAAIRHAIPSASPGVYVTMSLGLTFPFNIALGLPLLLGAVRALWE